jgi:hypothetical protein
MELSDSFCLVVAKSLLARFTSAASYGIYTQFNIYALSYVVSIPSSWLEYMPS